MISFTIDGEMTDLNTYIRAERSNRFAASTIKKRETQRVAAIAKYIYKIKPAKEPVFITYKWYCKNKKKDKSNIAAFAKKCIEDGLVKAGVLSDDGWENIQGWVDEFYVDDKHPRIEIIIAEPI